MIYILTYNAPHRKTQDLILRLKAHGYNNITVLATPWKDRKNFTPLIPHRKFNTLNIKPSDLCTRLGYEFLEVEIKELDFKNDLILIAGAGIIPKNIVENHKIINSHPAYLPYVRGLDSLKWAIFQNKPIGVTTHIISDECDAGKLIRRELVPLYEWDTFHSIANRQYEMEIDMLVDSIEDIKTASFQELSTAESEPNRRMPHKKEKELIRKLKDLIKKTEVVL